MNDYQEEFRLYLKKSREKMGLTQEEAADAIGVTVTTLQNWENKGRKPDGIFSETIVAVYKLNKEEFLKKYCNAFILPPTETEDLEEEKERKYPWPDCMPLEQWIVSIKDLKNFKLNELETELLGLEDIYSFKGTLDLDATKIINAINNDTKGEEHHNIPGNFDFTCIPYEFIKEHGVFNVGRAKDKLKYLSKTLKDIALSFLWDHPDNKTFDICDLTQDDFYYYAYFIPIICRTKYKNDLSNLLRDIQEILIFLKKHNNKYCLFDGTQFTELEYKNDSLGYKDSIDEIFQSKVLYNIHFMKGLSQPDYIKYCENIYMEPLTLYNGLIEIVQEPIMSNLEYLEYQNRLEFYEKNKDKGAVKPPEPTEMGLYVVPTEKGKELLKWFKEMGILKDERGEK